MKELTVEAAVEQIRPVTELVNRQLEELGCSRHIRIQVDTMIDEIFGNIARYAYGTETGTATVRVETEKDPPCVIITFIDRGKPFDPVAYSFRDTTRMSAGKRPVGGLGLFMVRKTMDEISYSREDGQNILTVRKKI